MRESKGRFGGGRSGGFGSRPKRREGRDRDDGEERSSRGPSRFGGSGRSFGGGGRGGFGERRKTEMHQGVCDSCGKDCEVPFKPTQSKPLYCSDCFRKKEAGNDTSSTPAKNYTYELDIINQKLDKIMKKLEIE